MAPFFIFWIFVTITNVSSGSADSDQILTELRKLIDQQNEQIRSLVIKVEVQGNDINRLNSEVKSLRNKVIEQDRVISGMQMDKFGENLPSENNSRMVEDPKSVPRIQPDNIELDDNKKPSHRRMLLPTQSDQQTVAFYAYLSTTEKDPGHHHTILFNNVVTNVGNGYNKHGGTFIAPVAGVYAFSYSISTEYNGRIPVEIVVNGHVVHSSNADSKQTSQISIASATIIVNMNQSDTCLLRTSLNTGFEIVGNIYSTGYSRSSFAGWKI